MKKKTEHGETRIELEQAPRPAKLQITKFKAV
jgi:hypothetical protein